MQALAYPGRSSFVITTSQNSPNHSITLRLFSFKNALDSMLARMYRSSLFVDEQAQIEDWSKRVQQQDFPKENAQQLCFFLLQVIQSKVDGQIVLLEVEKELCAYEEEIRGILQAILPDDVSLDSFIAGCKKGKEAFVYRLGDMLLKQNDDPLSEDLLDWVDAIYLTMKDPLFELNESSIKSIAEKIDQLFKETLLNSFDRYPVENQPTLPLIDPMLERCWTWENGMYHDWLSICRSLHPEDPPRSPFDGKEMQSIHLHELAINVKKWAIDFLLETGQPIPKDQIPTNQDLSLTLSSYTQEQAKKKRRFYKKRAQAFRERKYARELIQKMRFARDHLAEIEAQSREYVANERKKVEKMVQTHTADINKKFVELEEQNRLLVKEFETFLEQEKKEVERVKEENRVQNVQADIKAKEWHKTRQAELKKELDVREENHVRQTEALRNQIVEGEKKIEVLQAEARETLVRVEKEASVRNEIQQAEIQNQIQNIERNSQRAEEIWHTRHEENEKQIELIRIRNRELDQTIEQNLEIHRQSQSNLLRQIGDMKLNHCQEIDTLQSRINKMQDSINTLSKQLSDKTATCQQLQNQINHQITTQQHILNEMNNAKKKKKKWYKF
jgi:hypothetical protein